MVPDAFQLFVPKVGDKLKRVSAFAAAFPKKRHLHDRDILAPGISQFVIPALLFRHMAIFKG